MENKKLTLETKKCIVLDLGRAYLEYSAIDALCLLTFPDEPLYAVQAFKNAMSDDLEDPGIENKGFSNHVGWLEPIKETIAPDADALNFIEKAAEEVRIKKGALLFVGSGPAYLAAKAGVDFFAQDNQLEVIFAGDLSAFSYKKMLEKLKGRKFSICAVEDKEMPHGALTALTNIKGAKNFYAFTNNSESVFCAMAKKSGAKVFIQKQEFTGPSIILSPGVLLPLAAIGVDIKAVIEGATPEEPLDMESYIPSGCGGAGASRELLLPLPSLNIKNYSTSRRLLKDRGFSTELLVYTNPILAGFINWFKYASMSLMKEIKIHVDAIDLTNNADMIENYAKTNKGLFETFIHVGNLGRHNIEDLKTPADLNLSGDWLITDSMQRQRKTGVPIIRIEIPEVSPYFYGQMISMFSRTLAIMDIWK